ncbi:hypothetical protein QJS66_01960 [Kocuria rhizophila]|nr:hypothetical protein QJS66_01960 [Kocuria rhizophila]
MAKNSGGGCCCPWTRQGYGRSDQRRLPLSRPEAAAVAPGSGSPAGGHPPPCSPSTATAVRATCALVVRAAQDPLARGRDWTTPQSHLRPGVPSPPCHAFADAQRVAGDHEFHFVADRGGVIDVDLNVSMVLGAHHLHAGRGSTSRGHDHRGLDQQHLGVACDVDDTVMVTALPRPDARRVELLRGRRHARIPTLGCPP